MVVCRGRRVTLEVKERVLPNGVRVRVDKVYFPDSVAVLPVFTESLRVVLLKQYRPPIDSWIIEAPAGTVKEGEDPLEAARRELEEEAGLVASRVEEVWEGYLAPGYSTEKMKFYIAYDPSRGVRSPERHEVIEVVELGLGEALEMAARREIVDVKTILLLQTAARLLLG